MSTESATGSKVSKKLVWWIIGIVAVLLFGATLWGPIVSNVEQPKYTGRIGAIEIRDYAPMIIAETEARGDRREAISKGFRLIAEYIFGNNTAAQRVPMTAPVTQQGDGNTWRVRASSCHRNSQWRRCQSQITPPSC
jgi:hypothetical protein